MARAPNDVVDLRRFLIHVADPRGARGRRYPALAMLCAAVAAFGLDPFTGLRPVPHAATVRRLLHRVDGDALDAAISAYLQARTAPVPSTEGSRPARRVIAVDGKVVRGSHTRAAAAIQLLAAMEHHGVVLAQRQVASKGNEILSFRPLLEPLDLADAVLTTDALHTQCDPRQPPPLIWSAVRDRPLGQLHLQPGELGLTQPSWRGRNGRPKRP
ncbi:hypothetical protein ACFW9I_35080 [[Kitasatospora] papulosa]|uniref:hypothetical protein n=1 Tax=[Kitasatospora] papulosa TaxID=1464011 RepID=UPI0036C6EC56